MKRPSLYRRMTQDELHEIALGEPVEVVLLPAVREVCLSMHSKTSTQRNQFAAGYRQALEDLLTILEPR